jgi:RiboL-PSP-HEPN
MFESEKQSATNRLTEVRQLLETIKSLESTEVLRPDSTEVLILRGLFYVHLYATFEHSVNEAVLTLLRAVNDLKIKTVHLEPIFLSVSLDSDFNSLRDSGVNHRWTRRIDLLRKQSSMDQAAIDENVFSSYLQNIWQKNLQQIFDCFFINEPIVPNLTCSPFIDEIVNKRNAVAHGRESPVRVGSGTRSSDLHIRLDAISQIITHLIQCFERHVTELNFVRAEQRVNYQN